MFIYPSGTAYDFMCRSEFLELLRKVSIYVFGGVIQCVLDFLHIK